MTSYLASQTRQAKASRTCKQRGGRSVVKAHRLRDPDVLPSRELSQSVLRSRQYLLNRFEEISSEELHLRLLRHARLLLRLEREARA